MGAAAVAPPPVEEATPPPPPSGVARIGSGVQSVSAFNVPEAAPTEVPEAAAPAEVPSVAPEALPAPAPRTRAPGFPLPPEAIADDTTVPIGVAIGLAIGGLATGFVVSLAVLGKLGARKP